MAASAGSVASHILGLGRAGIFPGRSPPGSPLLLEHWVPG